MPTTFVVKYGGHAMDNPQLAKAFAGDIMRLQKQNERCVLIHGGGPQINALLTRLNIPSRFERGLRVTDSATMEAVQMVLSGTVNKDVVAKLSQAGAHAMGLSGRDADLFLATIKDPALGCVGTITKVQPRILEVLLNAGYVPVVAPIASDESDAALNINADTAAGAIAGTLAADYFVLVSDVPGVMKDGTVLSRLTKSEIDALIQENVITGGMIPKVEACLFALEKGAKQAVILDGTVASSLWEFYATKNPKGTLITL